MKKLKEDNYFTPLNIKEQDFKIPALFTFPFFYQPDELALIASRDLIKRIEQTKWEHQFWPNNNNEGLGKMFGVLVVEKDGELGYLSAFSGKIGDTSTIPGFVPPVFDRLTLDSYFKEGEKILEAFTSEIESIENNEDFKSWKNALTENTLYANHVVATLKNQIKNNKAQRSIIRKQLSQNEIEKLNEVSKSEQIELKRIKRYWKERLTFISQKVNRYHEEINAKKEVRKQKSNEIQKQLFQDYTFLNAKQESKDLLAIFQNTSSPIPPAGAGDCCAPKLLQYAYLNNYHPITMAEFWWGKSPNSVIRKHKHFYPACRSKCEPILGHMLQGLKVQENPMLNAPKPLGEIEVIFEDEYIIVINKPAELLSAPGKTISDCALNRVAQYLAPNGNPLLVHRLDMATSGILIFAKTKRAHKSLQRQFLNKHINKEYIAVLDGELNELEGVINLPLRVDLDNRPHQMVCYNHGKSAETQYKVIAIKDGKTKILFQPITGRTHQLRMHAAHPDGLNTPILGDDLYGTPANRLHLHAAKITFKHPIYKDLVTLESKPSFNF